jgi:elongation factor G
MAGGFFLALGHNNAPLYRYNYALNGTPGPGEGGAQGVLRLSPAGPSMSKAPDLSRLRNIGVVAHVDAGKTTLTERLLYYAGASHKIGEVHDGQAHMDYMAEEQAHGITITAAVTKLPWQGHSLQLIDTPGHVDFTIEVERSMRVLDGCVVVLDGVRGVEPQTQTVWRQRSRFGLPALFFVNKMDRPGADYAGALASIRDRLGAEPAPVTVPLEDGQVVHLIDRTLLHFGGEQGEVVSAQPCPDAIWQQVQPLREGLLLALAEADEALAELVLCDQEPPPEQLRQALRRLTLAGRIFPCFGGSALRNRGVQPVLDAVVALLPAPSERVGLFARLPGDGREEVQPDPNGPLVALAFKVQLWEGRRHVFARIYRGHLKPGERVAIPQAEGPPREEQVARLFEVDAGKKNRIDEAWPGQIVLLAGLRWAATGDTLCHPEHPLWLERIDAREPVLALAVEATSTEQEEKLCEVLDKLQQEDPTLRLEEDPETGQRLLRGMGELHLQIVCERLQREFQIQVRTGRPRVALRETLAGAAEADGVFDREVELERKLIPMKARVKVVVRPRRRGEGNRVLADPRILPPGASLSEAQAQLLVNTADSLLCTGPQEGAPMQDTELEILEVELFGATSTPQALQNALVRATQRAMTQAGALLLRPIMAVEVVVPEENLGMVLGDLQGRQAVIEYTEPHGAMRTIRCRAGLDRLLGYATDLRGMTHGHGQFNMQFQGFDAG